MRPSHAKGGGAVSGADVTASRLLRVLIRVFNIRSVDLAQKSNAGETPRVIIDGERALFLRESRLTANGGHGEVK